MASDSWQTIRLGELIELKRGYDLPKRNRNPGPFPIVSSSGISGYHAEAKVKGPGVITGRYGTIGKVYYITSDFWPLNTALYVRDFKGSDPRFISYFLRMLNFQAYSDKAAVPGLDRNALHTALVRVPCVSEQHAIAHILSALDDKIELNRRMSETLEAIARAIFKSWFVDFDPIRAKADGRQPVSMDAKTAARFPDSFVETEIGLTPSGWKIEQFSDHFSVLKGLSYKGKYLSSRGEGLPMHNLDSVYEGGGYKYEGLKWYVGEHKERQLVEPGDVVVTNTEQGFEFLLIGYPAIIPYHYGQTGLFSHHLYLLKPNPDTSLKPVFMYFLLRTRKYHDLVAGFTNGTTVNMLPADGLQRPKFAVPPEALLDLFYSLVEPTQRRIDTTYEENQTLVEIRDTLLPRLVSGEIRVKDAERFVEEHAG
jgi:type I restriction enzyme S subunit